LPAFFAGSATRASAAGFLADAFLVVGSLAAALLAALLADLRAGFAASSEVAVLLAVLAAVLLAAFAAGFAAAFAAGFATAFAAGFAAAVVAGSLFGGFCGRLGRRFLLCRRLLDGLSHCFGGGLAPRGLACCHGIVTGQAGWAAPMNSGF
jgi:hypothetical protein